jgi:hypothetical protein
MKIKAQLFSAIAVLIIAFTSCTKKYSDIRITSASTSILNNETKDIGIAAKDSPELDNSIDIVIENSGTKELVVSSIELGGTNASSFTLDKKTFSGSSTIGVGSTQIFSMSLKTNAVGNFESQVTIKSDAKDNNTYVVKFTGTVQ